MRGEETRLCIYCNQEKPVSEFSLEHIFPEALGGAAFPDVFKTRRVCSRCNSLSGLFVDGSFVRRFFLQNLRAEAYLKYADLDEPRAMPMRLLGTLHNIDLPEGMVCEVALGPHGGVAYHVHPEIDEERYGAMLGSNPIDSKKKGGNGTVFLTAQFWDQFWNVVFLKSVAATFKNARRISVNISFGPDVEPNGFFDQPDDMETLILRQIAALTGQKHSFGFSHDFGFEHRFLAKLGLALGHNLLGDEYLITDFAGNLRKIFWERDYDKRQSHGVLLDEFHLEPNLENDDLKTRLAIEGIHSIVVTTVGREEKIYLAGILYLFGMKRYRFLISDTVELWRERPEVNRVFFVAPQLERHVSCDIVELINYRAGRGALPKLAEIESRRLAPDQIPVLGAAADGPGDPPQNDRQDEAQHDTEGR